MATDGGDKFVLAIDVGTTSIRCHIYNCETVIIGEASEPVQLIYPNHDQVEICPGSLWSSTLSVCRRAIKSAKLEASDIASIGISSQRNTFTIWNKTTGEPYHNFITWKDTRSESLCNQWNASFKVGLIRLFGKVLHFVTRKKRFLAARLLRFTNQMVVMRLLWVLEQFKDVRMDAQSGEALYGTIDTFLIWKLTGGQVHVTEPSSACVSGMYDPFELKWASWAIHLFKLPSRMFPTVLDTNDHFGDTLPELFGSSIPIRASVGDQQAAMFAENCLEPGQVKVTLGTGSFVNVNTASRPHASFAGLYPVVGWKLIDETQATYLVEGSSADTGTSVEWARSIGLFDNPSESSDLAQTVPNANCYFVPAFSGLQAPYNDVYAVAGFIGIEPSTTKGHMTRAILESIGFRIKQLFDIANDELGLNIRSFKVDGGVSNNDFLCQFIADLSGKRVYRNEHREMSSLGAAVLAGLSVGMWKDKNELKSLRKGDRIFEPDVDNFIIYKESFERWKKAVERCLSSK
ncbi:putative glycerol kinase 5 [Halotydeus destructor]|nr:putative glycerol kinase 5 [Halotydeus destructor]